MLLRILKSGLFATFSSISLTILGILIWWVCLHLRFLQRTREMGLGAVAGGVDHTPFIVMAICFVAIFVLSFVFSWRRS
jgi:hypothetical protein